MLRRSLEAAVRADLETKMVFVAGPARTPEGIRLAPAPALLGRLA